MDERNRIHHLWQGFAAPDQDTTVLLLGAVEILVARRLGGAAPTVHRWPLGLDRLCAAWAGPLVPSPLHIEAAIETVERQVMQLPAARGDARRFIAIGESAGAWSSVAGSPVSISTVEGWFDALALASSGRPSALDGLPQSRHDLAALIVLREAMHHLGFDAVGLGDLSDVSAHANSS